MPGAELVFLAVSDGHLKLLVIKKTLASPTSEGRRGFGLPRMSRSKRAVPGMHPRHARLLGIKKTIKKNKEIN